MTARYLLWLTIVLCLLGTACRPVADPEQPQLHDRLSRLLETGVPAVSHPGPYSPEYVAARYDHVSKLAAPLLRQNHPPELGLYVGQLQSDLEQAARHLAQWDPARNEQSAGSTSDVLQGIESAMFCASAIQSFHAFLRDEDNFRQGVQSRISMARRELEDRSQQLTMEQSASLSQLLALPLLARLLRTAENEIETATLLLREESSRQFLAGTAMDMFEFVIGHYDELLGPVQELPEQPGDAREPAAWFEAIVDTLTRDSPGHEDNPFPETVHAYRAWHGAVETGLEARRLVGEGQYVLAMGLAALAVATRETAHLLEPVAVVGPPPDAGYDIDLAAIRQDIGRLVGECANKIDQLEQRGLPVPWFQTLLASISGAIAESDVMLTQTLADPASDLPTLEQTLALTYVNLLARCLRLQYMTKAVTEVLDEVSAGEARR